MRRRQSRSLVSLALLAVLVAIASAAPARASVVVSTSGTKVTIAQLAGGTESIYVRLLAGNLIVSTTRNGPPVTGGSIPVADVTRVLIDMRRSGAYPELRVENVRAPAIEWVMFGNKGNDLTFWQGLNCRRLIVQLGGGNDTLHAGALTIGELSTFDGGDVSDRFLLAGTRAIIGAEFRIRNFEVLDFE